MTGIYVHWPFCSGFCLYCDFYSENRSERMEEYTRALSREIDARKSFFDGTSRPGTLYFGGGTPSLVPARLLRSTADRIRNVFGVSSFDEFTMEVNPDDVTPAGLAAWREMGVNRLSLGVQSFCDAHLKWMRRRHSAEGAVNAFLQARSAGFDNISIDLIFGYAGLLLQEWEATVRRAVELHPEHISCYQLSIEPGSALGEMAARGEYTEASQDLCAEQYSLLRKVLAEAGYVQYEISNFSLPGRESVHNSLYWAGGAYLGLGAAAHSYDGCRTRSWNIDNISLYISDRAGNAASEYLADADLFNEKVMLSLRTANGLDAGIIPAGMQPAIDRLLLAGDLERIGSRIRIPASRLFISDAIIAGLFI